MTTSNDSFEDAAFEAFLQGKGELAQQLAAVHQPEPSLELDAAILTRMEADLAKEAAMPAAANDVVGPGFLTRWRLPLAAAASGVFAVLVLTQQMPPEQLPALVAAAPQAESAESMKARSATVEQDTTEKASRPEATVAEKRSKVKEAEISASLASGNGVTTTSEAKAASQAAEQQLADASPQIAQANDLVKSAPIAESAERSDSRSPSGFSAAEDTVASRDAAAAPVVAASAPVAAPVPYGASGGIRSAVSAAATHAPLIEDPKLWLGHIEELLRGDSSERVLSEWEKFRKAYPDYVVPEKLESQIKALKK